jgi:hypothetical protein
MSGEKVVVEKCELCGGVIKEQPAGYYWCVNGDPHCPLAHHPQPRNEYMDRIQAAMKSQIVLIKRIEAVMKCLGPCDHFDHHGDCQAHFLENPCSVGLLAESLKDLKSKQTEV